MPSKIVSKTVHIPQAMVWNNGKLIMLKPKDIIHWNFTLHFLCLKTMAANTKQHKMHEPSTVPIDALNNVSIDNVSWDSPVKQTPFSSHVAQPPGHGMHV